MRAIRSPRRLRLFYSPPRAQPQVAKEDVELLAAQFDLDKKGAERTLREAKGDVRAAMRALLVV